MIVGLNLMLGKERGCTGKTRQRLRQVFVCCRVPGVRRGDRDQVRAGVKRARGPMSGAGGVGQEGQAARGPGSGGVFCERVTNGRVCNIQASRICCWGGSAIHQGCTIVGRNLMLGEGAGLPRCQEG